MLFTEYSKLKGAEQCFKTFASEPENIESNESTCKGNGIPNWCTK